MSCRTPGRGAGTGANPLRRGADRARTRWHAVFALACVLAVVCAVVTGLAVQAAGERAAEARARLLHRVKATTVAQPVGPEGARAAGAPAASAHATWRYPDSRVHTGPVPVPPRTPPGKAVTIWVDDAGDVSLSPPRTADAITLDAIAAASGALAAVVLCTGALITVRLRRIEARSLRQWEREWERVEPHWSGRARPEQGADDD
ncbi:Rv1733c family protein [Streptomyces sp. HUAS TT3]|uniref:Rv1733c family protein n=1 Tax=Streptomyces sp. HUAS TT3 TaxID=3447510 RepID=UPI003F65BBAB